MATSATAKTDMSERLNKNPFEIYVNEYGSDDAKQLLERAKAMVPDLRSRIKEVDELRRLPQKTVDELHANGIFKMLDPRRYGGAQLSFREYMAIGSELGRGCGSTAWVVSLINMTKYLVAVSTKEKNHEELFGTDKNINICGVFEPRKCVIKKVEGGYFIEEGLWGFCSGSLHSDFFALAIPIVNEKGETIDSGTCLLPRSDVNIIDDWYTIAMRGTGSNSVTVKNVFVPEYRAYSTAKPIVGEFACDNLKGETLYNSAFLPVISLLLTAPALGMLRGALEYIMERLPKRRIQFTKYDRQLDSALTQKQLADAIMRIDTAHMHVFRAAEDIDLWAESGEYMSYEARARVRTDCSYAMTVAKEATDLIIMLGGASALAESNLLQRIYRDMMAHVLHGFMNPPLIHEMYGAIFSGQEPNTTLI
jgi:Acyl-CoA dehydrogenases